MKLLSFQFPKRIVSIACLLSGMSFVLPANAVTLREAIEHTVTTNPDILIAAKTRQANDYAVREALADYFPSVDVEAGAGRERTKNPTVAGRLGRNAYDTLSRKESSVFINQLLFDGLATSSEVKRLRADVKASAFDVNATAQDVGLAVAETYLDIHRLRQIVVFAKDNVGTHRRTLKKIKAREAQGVSQGVDLIQVKGRLALAISNLDAEQGNLRDSEILFTRIVGYRPHDLAPYNTDFPIPHDQEALVSQALEGNPRLEEAEYDVEEALYQYRAAKAAFSPRFDLQLGGSWNRNLDGSYGVNNDYFAMVRMTYNIFRGGGDLARVREAAYIVQRAQEIRNRTYRQVKETAALAWNAFVTSEERLPELIKHRNAAKKTVGAYAQQFKLGKRTLLDLLDQENEYFRSRIAVVSDRFEHDLSYFRMLNAMGVLLQTLGIPLPDAAKLYHARPPEMVASYDVYDQQDRVFEEEIMVLSENDKTIPDRVEVIDAEAAGSPSPSQTTLASASSEASEDSEQITQTIAQYTNVSSENMLTTSTPASATTLDTSNTIEATLVDRVLVKVAIFSNQDNASNLTDKLKQSGFDAFSVASIGDDDRSKSFTVLITPEDESNRGIHRLLTKLQKTMHLKGSVAAFTEEVESQTTPYT